MTDSETSAGALEPAPTEGRELSADLMSALAEAATPPDRDFDHQLTRASVSMRLFGRGEVLSIGKYQVVRRIGAGGMGEVYLCEDQALGRKVAIKRVLGPSSSAAHERLRREARALARLNHRNVVQVYDSGEHEGRTYLVMEYVEGQTLREWMRTSHGLREVLALFCDAGRGLAAAHAAGLVHRDFKPENVLIGADQIVRVADFGLALGDEQHDERTGTAPDGELPTRLSALGVAVGTRQYMPLEQILGGTVDARSDQFAFCMSLYEVIWGEHPFDYADLASRKEALLLGAAKLPSSHRDLYRVIRRGLERDPDARWPSMNALLSALERVPRRRRAWAWGVAVGTIVGLAGALWLVRATASLGVQAQAQEQLELAEAAIKRSDLAAAQAHAENVCALQDSLPEFDPLRGDCGQLFAIIEGMRSKPERSLVHAREAVWFYSLGEDNERLTYARTLLANALSELGRFDEAELELELLEQSLEVLLMRTEIEVCRGELGRADRFLGLARDASVVHGSDGERHHGLHYLLLRALVDVRLNHDLDPERVEALQAEVQDNLIIKGQLPDMFRKLEVTDAELRKLGFSP